MASDILIVDDEADIRELVAGILQDEGHGTRTARDSDEALAAVAMRLLTTGGLPLENGITGLGGELTWPNPTRPGDTLHVESEILEIVPSRSKPNQAVVKVKSTTLNQEEKPVYVFTGKILVFKRPQ